MAKKTVFEDGYNHYSHKHKVKITFMLSEAHRAALDDLMMVLGETNLSEYIRTQIFRPYYSLNKKQKQQLEELKKLRIDEQASCSKRP